MIGSTLKCSLQSRTLHWHGVFAATIFHTDLYHYHCTHTHTHTHKHTYTHTQTHIHTHTEEVADSLARKKYCIKGPWSSSVVQSMELGLDPLEVFWTNMDVWSWVSLWRLCNFFLFFLGGYTSQLSKMAKWYQQSQELWPGQWKQTCLVHFTDMSIMWGKSTRPVSWLAAIRRDK